MEFTLSEYLDNLEESVEYEPSDGLIAVEGKALFRQIPQPKFLELVKLARIGMEFKNLMERVKCST